MLLDLKSNSNQSSHVVLRDLGFLLVLGGPHPRRSLWHRPLLHPPFGCQHFSFEAPLGDPKRDSYAIWKGSKKRFDTRDPLLNCSKLYRPPSVA